MNRFKTNQEIMFWNDRPRPHPPKPSLDTLMITGGPNCKPFGAPAEPVRRFRLGPCSCVFGLCEHDHADDDEGDGDEEEGGGE